MEGGHHQVQLQLPAARPEVCCFVIYVFICFLRGNVASWTAQKNVLFAFSILHENHFYTQLLVLEQETMLCMKNNHLICHIAVWFGNSYVDILSHNQS